MATTRVANPKKRPGPRPPLEHDYRTLSVLQITKGETNSIRRSDKRAHTESRRASAAHRKKKDKWLLTETEGMQSEEAE